MITNKSLIVASSWSHLYLLFKDARSFEYKKNVPFCYIINKFSLRWYGIEYIECIKLFKNNRIYYITLECKLHIQCGLRSADPEEGPYDNLSASRIS